MLLLFQPEQGGEEDVLATRAYRLWWCVNGHPMLVMLNSRRLKCSNPTCAHYNILYVMPTETVELAAAV